MSNQFANDNMVFLDIPMEYAPPVPVPVPITLIESLSTSLKELRKGNVMMLPIRKICNINVEVSIHKETRHSYTLNISPIDFSVEDDALFEVHYKRDEAPISEDEFLDFTVRKVLIALKSIKIDKLNGKFTTTKRSAEEEKADALWSIFCQEFKDEENIVLSMNECCVCFTVTTTITNCEHAVCLDCISKLRTETVPDEHNSNQKFCPMCRQRILFLMG